MLVAAIVVAFAILGAGAAIWARSVRATAALAGAGLIAWIVVLVYALAIHDCRSGEHCDSGFLWFFGLFALFGWLLGLAVGSLLRRRSRRGANA